jgi:hypothetical protein
MQTTHVGRGADTAKRPRWRWSGPTFTDGLVVAILLVVSFLVRWPTRPTDGLYHDDAWVAIGAMRGGVGDLHATSSDHPGFTLALMGWSRISGVSPERLAWPVLVSGLLLAPILYLCLARWSRRSVALVIATCAAIASHHVMFSTRPKPYAVVALAILGLAAVIEPVCRRRWSPLVAGAWLISALVVASTSVFASVAVAVAGIVVVTHPSGDRWLRLGTVGLQAVLQAALLIWVQRSYDVDALTADWAALYDGYLQTDREPWDMARDLAVHVERTANVFPGGSGWLGVVVGVAAVVGLALAARHGPNALRGRLLGGIVLVAVVGAYLEKVPFGPLSAGALPGGRATIWLVPSLALGLAELGRLALQRVPERRGLASVEGAIAVAAAVTIVATAWGDVPTYPAPGSGGAAAMADARHREGTVIVVLPRSLHPFFASSDVPIDIEPTPDELVGFRPVPLDPTVVVSDRPLATAAALGQADQVLVYEAVRGFSSDHRAPLVAALEDEGFVLDHVEVNGWAGLEVWRRAG